MKTYRIALIAGDGIGQEVIPAGVEVLKTAASHGGFQCELTEFPWGSEFYLRTGRMVDPDVIEHFRSRGPGWQARINATLRKAVGL